MIPDRNSVDILSASPDTAAFAPTAKNRWQVIATFITFVLVFVWLFPREYFVGFGSGLDPSWRIALHMAYSNSLVWGRDIVFTYGPLGFLSSRMAIPEYRTWYGVVDLFLFTNVAYVTWIAVSRLTTIREWIAALGVAYCAGSTINLVDLVIVLFLVQVFHLFLHQETRRSWHLVIAAICALLSFFVKLNMGLLTVPLFLGYCAWQAISTEARRPALLVAGSLCLAIACSGFVLPVALIPYIKYSLDIASGYNDSMSVFIEGRSQYLLMCLAITTSLAFFVLCNVSRILFSINLLFRVGSAALLYFLLFKQGFVRADGHDAAYFAYVPLLLGLLYVSLPHTMRSGLALPVCLALTFGFAYQRDDFLLSKVADDIKGVDKYLEQAKLSDSDWLKTAQPSPEDTLPEGWLERIKDGSVDIIPWDVTTIFFNHLKYNPRPVFQSYSAYLPTLDGLNAAKYASDSRPDFVLFVLKCVDGRYCFGDEGQTQRSLWQYYRPVDLQAPLLLLKKRRNPYTVTRHTEPAEPGAALTGRVGEWLSVPQNGTLTYLNANIDYSLFGKLRSTFYRPDGIRIAMRFEDGSERDFRTYRGALSSGILISHFVDNVSDVKSYIENDRSSLKKITAFRVVSPSQYPGIATSFKYTLTSIDRSRNDDTD